MTLLVMQELGIARRLLTLSLKLRLERKVSASSRGLLVE